MRLPLLFALISTVATQAAPSWATATVRDVKTTQHDNTVDVVIVTDQPATFQSWRKLSAPAAVVLELLDTKTAPRTLSAETGGARVDIAQHAGRGTPLTRVVVPMPEAGRYDVTATGNTITMTLTLSSTTAPFTTANATTAAPPILLATNLSPTATSSAHNAITDGVMGRATANTADVKELRSDAPRFAQAEGKKSAALEMTYIGFRNGADQGRVFARLNGTAEFEVRKEGDNLLVLDIKNATIPLRNNKNHLDATFFNSPVKMITPSEVDDATPRIRIAIEMKSAVPYETKVEGNEIAVYFKN